MTGGYGFVLLVSTAGFGKALWSEIFRPLTVSAVPEEPLWVANGHYHVVDLGRSAVPIQPIRGQVNSR